MKFELHVIEAALFGILRQCTDSSRDFQPDRRNIVVRTMKHLLRVIGMSIVLLAAGQAFANEPVWTVSGLKMPESVEYDAARNRFYVSNVNGGVMKQDGNGSIGLIDGSGKLIDVDWVTGLNSPKGLALYKNKLYVADVKQLVVIDVKIGKIVARYEANGAKVLNGISINDAGKVFVSDWIGDRIYTLEDGELKVWLASPKLNSPNGLWADNTNLYVASWGKNPKKDDFSTETTGNLKKISLRTKKIKTLGQDGRWINMDGIARYPKNKWLVSDFIKGEILLIDKKGHIEKSLKTKKGSADIYFIHKKHLLVVPLLLENQVVAYKLNWN